ncbi:ABC transporter ATP-binding protein [Stenotrophomonas sp. ATCM1_4]|uniref:ABC transporter ATP-binding protein n=1 Tax=Stenotrophomonas sp. ATCM1_4 TaxID=2259330 RepID=UPI001044A326|nr:ABC transporter ATP-binding protein [Stenotrophomonas sp. ATCM1_4]TDB29245.1 ABC transporter ATP-binding protein [Stenotrophomonas sp. ATCM1_4]
MSSDLAIRVEGLCKSFPVYSKPHYRLLQMLFPRQEGGWGKEFQALKNINLAIKRGETVGIVGRNGSGKSTLLQVICGTLSPSSGDVNVIGRVAALLELGAGFNPEFTGRENVFLNGTVLGLTREAVAAKFDEIVRFADIGDFIDQPVKTYSSGMYVRLAFSVAIHVEPDILIVDEALSVGDEAFQRKCFARIQEIRDAGATILFVSHSASTVLELCDRAILLDRGCVLITGSPKHVITQYQKLLYASAEDAIALRQAIREEGDFPVEAGAPATSSPARQKLTAYWQAGLESESVVEYARQGAMIIDPRVETADGRRVNMLVAGDEYIYRYQVAFDRPGAGVRCGMMIRSITGVEIGGAATSIQADALPTVGSADVLDVGFKFRCLLGPGAYFLNAGVLGATADGESYLARVIDAFMFKVQSDSSRLATGFVDFHVAPSLEVKNPAEFS